MGVPALFRWLSKKYPKIIYPVVEEEERNIPDADGNKVAVPVNVAEPNPNGLEFDNLYLDMNGIVHPCTHPEGKPAPETEEDMMIEVFKYTERIVSMIRPRKLLFMAIDGVAPRAKMNQQRSRRFRSAQEAKDKEIARKEAVAMWEAMGKELSEEEKTKEAWDSNAITPGTPFMHLLAASLRFWVVHKINTDPGWKQMQVIISDASVPGEGEHKIMDFIRRQRTNTGHDPNTKHVIYGLDADLIMLALATHEPHFRVLREDVFFTDGSSTACRTCGQEGHYAAQCTGVKAEIKKTPVEKKPFIFLDVSILREYLEVELNVSQAPFPFHLERAIDDWVLLIFFVGNDFLPHLPSLEIREGAIDTLLKIWKQELPRMGGYLTNHGQIELSRAQIILEGLANREDEIFRRRREVEERHEQNAKRRKLDIQSSGNGASVSPSPSLFLTAPPIAPSVHPSLPPRPVYDFAATADSIGLGAPPNTQSIQNIPTAVQALAGSNHDVVANRRAIRMANMSAGEMLKAELFGLAPTKPDLSLPPKPTTVFASDAIPASISASLEATKMSMDVQPVSDGISAYGAPTTTDGAAVEDTFPVSDVDADGEPDPDVPGDIAEEPHAGAKRKHDEFQEDVAESLGDDDDDTPTGRLALKVNPDGTVEQEDRVKLWEPGYKERYYRQKFGVELTDTEFRKELTKRYVEGLAWVLHYYYQGTPSWQWYYPYHFAPFAADFVEVDKMDIKFDIGQPFKPFEQLMGVFPAASRKHIPPAFQPLMVDEDSPIIDFYPSTFEVDMNGKKMAWQGVALLPFIDERRLLDAMATQYPNLTEEEIGRNRWGDNVIYASDEHPLYPFFEQLFGKRKQPEPVPVDIILSKGISGSVMSNPDFLPGSTYYSPLTEQGMPDIKNDRSLSVLYFFPKRQAPHRSMLLPGVKRPPRILSSEDLDALKYGSRRPNSNRDGWDRGRGRGRGNGSSDRGGYRTPPSRPHSQPSYSYDRPYGGRGGTPRHHDPYPPPPRPSYPQHTYGVYSSSSNYGPPSRGLPPRGSSQSQNQYGSYRGAYGGSSQSGYEGYGGYGNQSTSDRYGYQNAVRGGSTYGGPSRGRGRGGWQ